MNQDELKFSYDYFQPSEYRFSLDSVLLAKTVANYLRENNLSCVREKKFLDLCAGCGIIGMELKFHLPEIKLMDFVEIQDVYKAFFNENLKQITTNKTEEDLQFQFINSNYKDLIASPLFQNKYDYIISNPPYFEKGEGLLSPSDFKNRCRFFLDATSHDFIDCILSVLAPGGRAFILARNGKEHGRDRLHEFKKITDGRAIMTIFSSIRGTQCYLIVKNS